jgi:hypothetical protein
MKRNPRKYIYRALIPLLFSTLLGCPFGEAVIFRGEISADTVVVVSGTSGNVEKMEKDVGDRVDKGELILRVGLKETEEKLERERERLEGIEERIEKAREDYEKSEYQVRYARGRYLKNRMLFSKGAIAEKEVLRTKEEYDFAETLKERAKRDYEEILGEIERIEKEISKGEEEYGSIFILSPKTGFITKSFIWEGGYLLRGDNVVEIAEGGSILFKGEIEGRGGFALGDDAFVIPIIPMSLVSGLISGYVSAVEEVGDDDNFTTLVTIRLRPESRWDILGVGTTAVAFIP